MYKVIDGKALAAKMRAGLKEEVESFTAAHGEVGLAVVLAGNDPASQVYVRNKIKACAETGIRSHAFYLPADVTQPQIEELVSSLAENKAIHGILVQLPLPAGLDAERVLNLIPYEKDVDGFSAENIGKLAMGRETLVACTPYGVMKMLESENISLKGKNAVVIGRSNIVGSKTNTLTLST